MIKISINDLKITAKDIEGKTVSSLSDKPSADGMSAEDLKGRFDALSNLLIARFNSVIDALMALTGAGEIGASVNGAEAKNVAGVLTEAIAKALAAETAADGKQDVLSFDTTPIINSTNPVTSGGVYQALQDMSTSGGVVVDSVLQNSPNPVKNQAIYSEFQSVRSLVNTKVDKETGKGLSANDYTNAEKSKLAGMDRLIRSVTLLETGWTQVGSTYQASPTVSGILASDYPHIGLSYQGDSESYLAEVKEYGKISYAQAASGGILFVCLEEKPLSDLHLQVEVMR